MTKFFATILLSIATIVVTNAQSGVGYMKEAGGGFVHTTYKSSSDNKIAGTSLDLRINYSLLGNIIFRDNDRRFMIGDHIGCGFSMGKFKKPSDDFPLMMGLNLEFGVKASYAISDELHVGLKYILGATNYFSDLKNDFGLSQKPSIVPAVRFKHIMGSAGFGTAKVGQSGAGNSGKFMMIEGRYLFGDLDDSPKFLFLRFENYSGKNGEVKQTGSQIYFGIGVM
jgi:hypothetical protein